jgi:hypothetical protein
VRADRKPLPRRWARAAPTANRSEIPEPIVRTPAEARSGSKEGVVRYILIISLALVVILLIASYLIA